MNKSAIQILIIKRETYEKEAYFLSMFKFLSDELEEKIDESRLIVTLTRVPFSLSYLPLRETQLYINNVRRKKRLRKLPKCENG